MKESVLFLLLLISWPCESEKLTKQLSDTVELVPKVACDGNSCLLTPENLFHLQRIIDSDKVIVLDGGVFNVDETYGFISIKSMSNLTIIGSHGRETVIHSSPQSRFGFHMGHNATNITLTGLTIQNCGYTAPYNSKCHMQS